MRDKQKRKSIFRSLFVPMILIMVVQAFLFYTAAVYGGIEESLSQNAVDILNGNMNGRKNELETVFNNRWTALDDCITSLNEQYAACTEDGGSDAFNSDTQKQIDFLKSSGELLIRTLRYSEANGIFVILSAGTGEECSVPDGGEQKYGLCIRDMDQDSRYTGTEDLLLERAPSSIVDTLGCMLDSWWDAKYTFRSYDDGAFYYAPLFAAYANPNSNSTDLAYFAGMHQISGSDQKMVSYSVPLRDADGTPYAVLGVELSVKYLSSLLPSKELYEQDKGCYILALRNEDSDVYEPITGTGALYNRCYGDAVQITRGASARDDGFQLTGRDGTKLYTVESVLGIYNNNSPFESRQLVLLAAVENHTLFSYISQIKFLLLAVALVSLVLGIAALIMVSRHFAAPITALARKASHVDQNTNVYSLEHIGIIEIDQLVDSIEGLSLHVSRNSARTEFFSRMSHDMRTPMNAIISFSSDEVLEAADEKTKDAYLKKINESGVYLLGLINEVLDLTKIESNNTELHSERVCAAQIFDTPVDMIRNLAQKKSIDFKTDIDIPPNLYIIADKQHLCQIVMNLLSNAVKFTPQGGHVSLSVSIADGSFHISVSDTGIGISEEFQKQLYTPFSQENGNHEGTGLGLSISKRLVTLMNGTITCKSVKNEGSVFTVDLPVTPTDGDTKAVAGQSMQAPPDDLAALAGKRILVCEDNAINISIIKLLLERVGITVDVAMDGVQGTEMFQASSVGSYSAILMDIRMPVMNGLEATAAIRKLPREDALSVPIVAMTADAFAEDEQISRSAGMNEHLSKPIDIKRLYSTLLKYIR